MGSVPYCCKSNHTDSTQNLNIKVLDQNNNGAVYEESPNKIKPEALKLINKKIFNNSFNRFSEKKVTRPSDSSLKILDNTQNTQDGNKSGSFMIFLDKERSTEEQTQLDKDSLFKLALEKLPLMSAMKGIQKEKIIKLAVLLELKHYQQDEIIISICDTRDNDLYFIIEGTCTVHDSNDKFLRFLFPGENFGEILFYKKSKERTATVKSLSKVKCLVLKRKDFDESELSKDKIFFEYMQNLFMRRYNSTKLNDLFCVKFLYKSNYAHYFIVHDNINVYQIKIYSKSDVLLNTKMFPHLRNEKNIFMSSIGDFLLSGIKTFQDEGYFYILSEYIPFANLKDYLFLKKELLKDIDVKFYFACMLSAVEQLHKNKIIHRDIKPGNFNIITNGYLILYDFYTAKFIGNGRTNTVIGTPNYMSPEVIKGKNYGLAADFWSLGVSLFELAYASYPFGKFEYSEAEIYDDILNRNIDFDNFTNSQSDCSCNCNTTLLNNLLDMLLQKDPIKRCCNFEQIKKHKFFDGFDWDKFYKKEMKPPYLANAPPIRKYFESKTTLKSIIEKKDSKYFFEDSCANEVIIGDNPELNISLNEINYDW